MNTIRSVATGVINVIFVCIAAGFAVGTAVYLVLAAYTVAFTNDSPGAHIARVVGCLTAALLFKFLSRLDEFEFVPATTTTTTTRRAGTRRPTRKA
jgi:hypothetical protein